MPADVPHNPAVESVGSPSPAETKDEPQGATAAPATGGAAGGEADAAQDLLAAAAEPVVPSSEGEAEAEVEVDADKLATDAPAKDSLDAAAAASLPTPPPSAPLQSDSPLTKILEGLPALSIKEQELVQRNLERIGGYPRELPLSTSWSAYESA